jgi:hypothetical protein
LVDNTDAAIDRLDALLGGCCDAREIALDVPLLTRPTLWLCRNSERISQTRATEPIMPARTYSTDVYMTCHAQTVKAAKARITLR